MSIWKTGEKGASAYELAITILNTLGTSSLTQTDRDIALILFLV